MTAVPPSRRPVRHRRAAAVLASLLAATATCAGLVAPAGAAVNPNVTPPGAPAIVAVTPGDGSITVEWEPSSVGDPATDVTVEAAPDHVGCAWASGPSSCTITGLTNGRAYSLDVMASNAGGRSVPVAWPALVVPFGRPGAPQSVTTVPADGAALVAWAAPSSDGGRPVQSYSVTSLPAGGSCEVSTGPLMCQVTGLTNGVPYVFLVVATNAAGPGASSAPVAAVTPRTVPGGVTGIDGLSGDRRIDVTWTPPVDDGGAPVTSYSVTTEPAGASCTWTAGPLACALEGLENGTDYTVVVTPTNAAGVGVSVRSSRTYRPVTLPTAPSVRWTTPRDGAADVVVGPPSSDGGTPVVGYTVTASSGQRCTVTSVPLRCTVRGLVNGAAVTFTATASNAVGAGPASLPSAQVVPFTAPSAPTSVVAASVAGRVHVRWTAPQLHGGRSLHRYLVEVTTDGKVWRAVAASLPHAPRASLTGLRPGVAYGVRVVALNLGGRHSVSAPTLVRVRP